MDSLNRPEPEALKLIDVEGHVFSLPKEELLKFAFFEKHIVTRSKPEMRLEATSDQIERFVSFVEGRPCEEVEDVFGVVTFACSIRCEAFARYCIEAGSGVVMPEWNGDKKLIEVFQAIVKALPTRTFSFYERLLIGYSRDLKERLRKAARNALHRRSWHVYRPLPLPLFKKKISIGILHDIRGRRLVAAISDNKWIPVDVFGEHFCPFECGVKNFHLCFNRYVIYESMDGSIIKKDLVRDGVEKQVFASCKLFASMYNKLIVVCQTENAWDLLYRLDNRTGLFEELYPNLCWRIKAIRGDGDDNMLFVLENGRVVMVAEDGNMYSRCPCNPFYLCSTCETSGINEDASMINVCGVWTNIVDFVGYSLLQTYEIAQNMYETRVLTKVGNRFEDAKTQVHEKVIAISDVLLLFSSDPDCINTPQVF